MARPAERTYSVVKVLYWPSMGEQLTEEKGFAGDCESEGRWMAKRWPDEQEADIPNALFRTAPVQFLKTKMLRMSDLTTLPETILGRYRHYKGGEYEVVSVARHSETLEPLVVYRPLYHDAGWWVRPHAMFFEQIEVNGQLQPRFALLKE